MRYRLGIDLGGTKTEVLVLGPDQRPVYRERVATPAHSYDEILAMIADLVTTAEGNVKQEMTIGIGIPGAISPATGLLRNSNTVCMNGRPFLSDVETLLQRRIRVENDANCFTLSEALGGAARNQGIVFGVIIGTGTGGGLVPELGVRTVQTGRRPVEHVYSPRGRDAADAPVRGTTA